MIKKKNLSVTTFLDKRATKAGIGVIKIVVTCDRIQRLYSTRIKISIIDWEKLKSGTNKDGLSGRIKDAKLIGIYEKLYGNPKTSNSKEEGFFTRANRICLQLNQEFTFEKFKILFDGIEINNFLKSLKDSLIEQYEQKINQLTLEKRIASASNYRCSLNSILKFIKSLSESKRVEFGIPKIQNNLELEISFKSITTTFLQEYENFMLSQGKSNNNKKQNDLPAKKTTVGIYLRPLRAIFNSAIKDNITTNYPFGKGKYVIPKGGNIKKALQKSDIEKILNYTPDEYTLEKRSYDFWILSYLCNGMNFADILRLKWNNLNLKERYLVFSREKTKRTNKNSDKEIKVILIPEAIKIIDCWKSRNNNSIYLFPFLEGITDEVKIKKTITQFIHVNNNWTAKIALKLDINSKLGTYVSRHSFSTTLLRSGAPITFISKALGHENVATTESYFGDFEDEKVREYMNFLI
jgi:integrase